MNLPGRVVLVDISQSAVLAELKRHLSRQSCSRSGYNSNSILINDQNDLGRTENEREDDLPRKRHSKPDQAESQEVRQQGKAPGETMASIYNQRSGILANASIY